LRKCKGRAEGEAEGRARGEVEGRAKDRAEEAREATLRVGRKEFGQTEEVLRTQITAIDKVDQLDGLLDRILDVSTWEELLAAPGAEA
jgi:hypothetical protein